MTGEEGTAEGGASRWELLGREPVAECGVFRVDRLRARSPRSGRIFDRYVLDVPDWVSVVAFTEDGRLLMVEQYRFGAGILSLEFPAGILEQGEDPAVAARRELREETGYEPGSVEVVGQVYADPALQGNRLYAVVARGCRPVGAPEQDEGEDVHVRLVPAAEIGRLIREGEVQHALALTAWLLYQESRATG